MEDKQILTLLWKRAENALDALSAKYGKRLLSIACNILGIRQDAEEAVNDTYLALWNAIPPTRPEPLSGYVYQTGRNICLDKLRYLHAGKRDSRYTLSLDELAECIPGTNLEDEFAERELGLAINQFLHTLSRDDRALFLRRYWFGDEVALIAKDLNLRPNTAAVRLGRLRNKLRHYLTKEGFLHA